MCLFQYINTLYRFTHIITMLSRLFYYDLCLNLMALSIYNLAYMGRGLLDYIRAMGVTPPCTRYFNKIQAWLGCGCTGYFINLNFSCPRSGALGELDFKNHHRYAMDVLRLERISLLLAVKVSHSDETIKS